MRELTGNSNYKFFWHGPPGTDRARKSDAERERDALAQEAWEVNGWRIFYQIGVEQRWFEGATYQGSFIDRLKYFLKHGTLRLTPHEAVLNSDFENLVERISIMKAKI